MADFLVPFLAPFMESFMVDWMNSNFTLLSQLGGRWIDLFRQAVALRPDQH